MIYTGGMAELYHVLNRGVEKRDIFLDDGDRVRFVHNLYEFNDTRPANNTTRHMNDLVGRSWEREPLVQIHGWCLMGNHYHLLLSEAEGVEGGLTKFIMKLNVGHAKFFNEKYKRSGALFQGRTKKVLIKRDAHFLHILNYIHLNPLDRLPDAKHWRERRVEDVSRALAHLHAYRWSSFLDYCGQKNFPSLLTTGLFQQNPGEYVRGLGEYLLSLQSDQNQPLPLSALE